MSRPKQTPRKREEKKRKPDLFLWALISIAVALLIIVPVRGKYRGFLVSSDFMEPTLRQGDIVMVKYVEDGDSFSVGDIIVFQYPPERSQYRFGRIAATGGQRVQIYEKKLYVDNVQIDEPPTVFFTDRNIERDLLSVRDFFGPFDLPKNSYFILCDNRDNSIDSRYWHELPVELVIGKPRYIYFTWKHDPNAPALDSPFNVVKAFFYNLFKFFGRAGFDRIGKKVT